MADPVADRMADRTDPVAERLPPLLAGRRRGLLARLVGTGLAQAGLVGLTAVVMPRLLGATDARSGAWAAGALLAGALALGLVRSWERVLAERLGQDYVQEIRRGLVASSLVDGGPSVGITVARTTNDLSSVRNWVALGVTPLVVGVPLVLGAVATLAVLEPWLAAAVGVPVALLGVALLLLARVSFARSRRLRKERGRLASLVSDTVHAATSIRAAGGEHRELRHVHQRGRRVADAAVARARVAGHIRGVAVAAAGVAMVAVAAVGTWTSLPGAIVATALTVVGVLTGPLADLGRVVEYRQSFRAARRIIGPALVAGASLHLADTGTDDPGPALLSGLRVRDLAVAGRPVPDLDARPGDTVVLRSADPARVAAVLAAVAGLASAAPGTVLVGGRDVHTTPPRRRRELVGLAARDLPLERGSIGRAVRYRRPDSTEPIERVLAAVGLAERVAALPEKERTTLRRGGEPLTSPERAQVRLARALYGAPPLLVVDHLDAQLGASRREVLRRCVAEHRGVALVASDDPSVVVPQSRTWDLDAAG
jgi:ABC-type multidrug transport system fused ATPase/permease subunit